MKLFSYILILIIQMQSFAPCQDHNATASLNGQLKTEFVKTPEQPQKFTREACSPFCQCSCCATPSVTGLSFVTLAPPYADSVSYAAHLPGNYIDVSLPVWQPPRVIS